MAGQPGTHPDRTSPAGSRLVRVTARIRVDLPLAVLDAVLVVVALGAMLTLRFDGAVPPWFWSSYLAFLPTALGVTVAVNWLWGLYGQIWRHASVLEARRILLAGATLGIVLTATVTIGPRLLPISVVVLGAATYTMLAGAVRFQSRLFALRRRAEDQPGLRVAVLGAGESGAALVRDMLRSPRAPLVPVALLDDDPRTHGRTCSGFRVVGSLDDLPAVVREHRVHEAILAVPSASAELVRRVADLAEAADVPLRILPGVAAFVGGRGGGASVRDLRDLRIEDLLGREQVRIDLTAVRTLLTGRRVLVTGAGGSIGSEIARQAAAFSPGALLVLDHDETHLYDLAATLPVPCTQLLVDVRDRDVVARTFAEYRPEVVFHAAAHKHVPLLEEFPAEAVRTNLLGTANIVAAATATGTDRLVFISTDKAVQPTSVMGASKRFGEHITLGCRPPGARYCAVRFGNVLGSRGSVIPTFLRQIGQGGPVTVTDPRMTRFFMSIPEAAQLVLQATALSAGGEVFILEMGEPVPILDLARRMIRLAGRRIGEDVELRVTGVRAGERLNEQLHAPDEDLLPTAHPSIHMVRPALPHGGEIDDHLAHLDLLAAQGEQEALRRTLFRLVCDTGEQPAVPAEPVQPSRQWAIELSTRGTCSRSNT